MKKLIPLLLTLTACAGPTINHNEVKTENNLPTPTHAQKLVKHKKKKTEAPGFCSDALTVLSSPNNQFQDVKNNAPKTFETFLMRDNSLLFLNPKRGKISKGNNSIEVKFMTGQSMVLKERNCNGQQLKIKLNEKLVSNN